MFFFLCNICNLNQDPRLRRNSRILYAFWRGRKTHFYFTENVGRAILDCKNKGDTFFVTHVETYALLSNDFLVKFPTRFDHPHNARIQVVLAELENTGTGKKVKTSTSSAGSIDISGARGCSGPAVLRAY